MQVLPRRIELKLGEGVLANQFVRVVAVWVFIVAQQGLIH